MFQHHAKLPLLRVIVFGDACKPNSVFPCYRGGSYLSGIGVATNLKQPTRERLPEGNTNEQLVNTNAPYSAWSCSVRGLPVRLVT